MLDGFWSGLLGGLFGPAIMPWLIRYKYRVIFLLVMVGVHISCFVVGVFSKGLHFAIQAVVDKTFSPVGILAPMAIALIAVFVVFICSMNFHNKKMVDKIFDDSGG